MNQGEQTLALYTDEWDPASLVYQVTDVRRTLTSVAKLCDRGNRVVFGKGGGVVQNLRNGKCTAFKREGGIYILEMWLDIQPDQDAPFQRRGN